MRSRPIRGLLRIYRWKESGKKGERDKLMTFLPLILVLLRGKLGDEILASSSDKHHVNLMSTSHQSHINLASLTAQFRLTSISLQPHFHITIRRTTIV